MESDIKFALIAIVVIGAGLLVVKLYINESISISIDADDIMQGEIADIRFEVYGSGNADIKLLGAYAKVIDPLGNVVGNSTKKMIGSKIRGRGAYNDTVYWSPYKEVEPGNYTIKLYLFYDGNKIKSAISTFYIYPITKPVMTVNLSRCRDNITEFDIKIRNIGNREEKIGLKVESGRYSNISERILKPKEEKVVKITLKRMYEEIYLHVFYRGMEKKYRYTKEDLILSSEYTTKRNIIIINPEGNARVGVAALDIARALSFTDKNFIFAGRYPYTLPNGRKLPVASYKNISRNTSVTAIFSEDENTSSTNITVGYNRVMIYGKNFTELDNAIAKLFLSNLNDYRIVNYAEKQYIYSRGMLIEIRGKAKSNVSVYLLGELECAS